MINEFYNIVQFNVWHTRQLAVQVHFLDARPDSLLEMGDRINIRLTITVLIDNLNLIFPE